MLEIMSTDCLLLQYYLPSSSLQYTTDDRKDIPLATVSTESIFEHFFSSHLFN